MALGNMTYWSGVWATVILLMALAVTPALTILRWPALVDVRRMIGVTALVYTFAHMVFYFALRSWNFATIANETVTRATLIVATLSTIGLIALAATSLDAAIRRLGAKNWQRLHSTNYAITALAILHVVLARGTYAGAVPARRNVHLAHGLEGAGPPWAGCRRKALALLAVASCLCTALLEAGFLWARRGYEPPETSPIISIPRCWRWASRPPGRSSGSASWLRLQPSCSDRPPADKPSASRPPALRRARPDSACVRGHFRD